MTEENSNYTLSDLVARAGTATREEALLFLEGVPEQELVEAGKRVATSRISTDTARLYGYSLDFLEAATPAQLDCLVGYPRDLLRVAIWVAAEGDRLWKEHKRSASDKAGGKAALLAVAEQQRAALLGRREVLTEALYTLAGENARWTSRIATAYGTTATTEKLATSIRDLTALARELLVDPSPGIAARREKVTLDEAWLQRAEVLTGEFKNAAESSEAATASPAVSQAEVDLWDGINLYLLEKIIDLHEAGHRADPTIPRLVPISLRSWFRPSTRSQKTPPAAPTA